MLFRTEKLPYMRDIVEMIKNPQGVRKVIFQKGSSVPATEFPEKRVIFYKTSAVGPTEQGLDIRTYSPGQGGLIPENLYSKMKREKCKQCKYFLIEYSYFCLKFYKRPIFLTSFSMIKEWDCRE